MPSERNASQAKHIWSASKAAFPSMSWFLQLLGPYLCYFSSSSSTLACLISSSLYLLEYRSFTSRWSSTKDSNPILLEITNHNSGHLTKWSGPFILLWLPLSLLPKPAKAPPHNNRRAEKSCAIDRITALVRRKQLQNTDLCPNPL